MHRLSLLIMLAVGVATRVSAQPVLTATPLDVPPGAAVTVTIAGTPGHAWAVGGSFHGSGLVVGGVALGLGADVNVLGTGVLDGNGAASFTFTPPPASQSTLYYIQAVTAADTRFSGALASQGLTIRPAGVFTNAPVFPQGLSAGGSRVTNVGEPTAATDAATKAYVDSAASSGASGPAGGDLAGTYPNPSIAAGAGANIISAINSSGGTIGDARLSSNVPLLSASNVFSGATTFAGGLLAGGTRIQNVGAPVSANDAATKAYVDSITPSGPSGPASGDLSGNYPSPVIAPTAGGSIVAAINATGGTIGDAHLSGNVSLLNASSVFTGIPTFAGGLLAGGARIQNLATPIAGTDAATKDYVDRPAAGRTCPASDSSIRFRARTPCWDSSRRAAAPCFA